jgi:hypothetical protein
MALDCIFEGFDVFFRCPSVVCFVEVVLTPILEDLLCDKRVPNEIMVRGLVRDVTRAMRSRATLIPETRRSVLRILSGKFGLAGVGNFLVTRIIVPIATDMLGGRSAGGALSANPASGVG